MQQEVERGKLQEAIVEMDCNPPESTQNEGAKVIYRSNTSMYPARIFPREHTSWVTAKSANVKI